MAMWGGHSCPPPLILTLLQMPKPTGLDCKYEYRRRLPHYQKAGRALFVTFCKANRCPFPPEARDTVLRHCLHDHGKRFQLHAAVVMPEHVHLLLTPLCDEQGWPYALPSILKRLKGTSARSINKLLGSCGPVWQEESFDHVLRSQESLEEKLEYLRQNPVRRGLVKKSEDYPWLWIEQTTVGTCYTFSPASAD
jgi:REP element-mobilizing transposase RayT